MTGLRKEAVRDGISQAYSEVKSLGAQIVSETYLASKAVESEAWSGLKDGFSDLFLADRTREAIRGLTRMLDSFLLTTISLGDIGYDSVEAFISVAKTSVWGMTVVNSFESLVGSAQNIYVVSPSSDDTMETLKWAFHAYDRAVGLAASIEKISLHVPGTAKNLFGDFSPLISGSKETSELKRYENNPSA